MMSSYDLIKGDVHVQNCKASDWLVCIYLCGSHDQCLFLLTLIGPFWSYDQNNLPCSFQLNCLHQVVLFVKKKKKKKTRLFFVKIH